MLHITKIGENQKHDRSFFVDRPHGHPVLLLILVKTPAKFFVDTEWIETPPGTAVIFREGQKHLYGLADNSLEYIDDWLHIEPPVSALSKHFPFGRPIILHNTAELYSLFHLIHAEYFSVSHRKNMIIDHLTTALLNKIEDESNMNEYPEIYYKIVSLREKIYSNPRYEWNIPEIASSLHISEGYFHSVYKHFFNKTCISDVIDSRIQAACEILTSTNKTVEDVAEVCGYHNTEHFIRQFKKIMGNTPTKYRKSMK